MRGTCKFGKFFYEIRCLYLSSPYTLYSAHYNVHCTWFRNALTYLVMYNADIVHCAVYYVICVLHVVYTVQCAVYYVILCVLHVVYTVQCAVCTLHYTVCTTRFSSTTYFYRCLHHVISISPDMHDMSGEVQGPYECCR